MVKAINDNQPLWHHLSLEQVFKYLHSSIDGLTSGQAAGRLKSGGRNELPQVQPASWLSVLSKQFSGILINILLVAAAVSFILGERVDSLVILAAVIVNVVVGTIQENKAEQALYELRKIVSHQATVWRDGKEHWLPAVEVVPGDVVLIKEGDRVPADGRLIEANSLEINEANLTGESASVVKRVASLPAGASLADRQNLIYMGTAVVKGVGRAVVVTTGLGTEVGQIAKLLTETKNQPTPLQNRLYSLGRYLSAIILSLCLVVFIVGVTLGFNTGQMFTTAVAIAVAAVPEGLAVAITIILTIGMRRILKQQGLVRELLAAETLGSTTVICTDKTGTLTTGDMRLAALYHPGEGEVQATPAQHALADQTLLSIAVISSDAYIENVIENMNNWQVRGSATERALIFAGLEAGLNIDEVRSRHPRLDQIPFDSEKKFMMTLNSADQQAAVYLKGAPEVVLNKCRWLIINNKKQKLTADRRLIVMRKIDELSKQGLRLLAFAKVSVPITITKMAEVEGDDLSFVFYGLAGIKDPLREGVKETIAKARRAGIKVVMITGDHRLTAQAIAGELNLPVGEKNIIDGSELKLMDDHELRRRINEVSVFARTTPRDKPRIVTAWMASGQVVAMTGDGVNDAPALKSANIGIALGTGSDVSKEVADIVLLNNNFSTIVAAVEEGRVIFHNIKKFVTYLLSDSFSEILLLLLAFLISAIFIPNLPLPILATQILWINLVTDTFPALAFTIDKTSPEIMTEPPIKPSHPILDWRRKILIVFMSAVRAVTAIGLFIYLWQLTQNVAYAQTAVFSLLVISSLGYALSSKQMLFHFWHQRTWNNYYLLVALFIALLLQLLVVYLPGLQNIFHTVPLSANDWLLISSLVGIIIVMVESVKHVFIKFYRHEKIT